MSRKTIISVITFSSFIIITLIVILLAQGYRLDRQTNTIYGTGTLVATSDPGGSTLTLNDQPRGVTNTTISNLVPGEYDVKISKEGYSTWENKVTIEKGKVLTVEALMIPVNPSLAPITSTLASQTWLSPDGQKLAYSVPEGTSAGIWMLDLSSQPFNLGRKPLQLVADTEQVAYSQAEIQWSPSSKDLLVTIPEDEKSSYLISIDNPREPKPLDQTTQSLLAQWEKETASNAEELQANFPEDIQDLIDKHANTIVWSPDNLNFMYSEEKGDTRTYYAYNKEDKEKTKVLERPTSAFTRVQWYADSMHFIILEKESESAQQGAVSIIDIDGTNKRQVFKGTLIGDSLYTYLNGAKLVILTSFNLQEQTYYLYAINLR